MRLRQEYTHAGLSIVTTSRRQMTPSDAGSGTLGYRSALCKTVFPSTSSCVYFIQTYMPRHRWPPLQANVYAPRAH